MRKNKVVKKSIVITIILAMIISLISVLAIPIFASETVVHTPFEGYSGDADIEAITNTAKNEDGSYTNPISTEVPKITVLIPGFGSHASAWSNNYYNGCSLEAYDEEMAYNNKSFLEKLRDYTDANIYYATVTSDYPPESKNENGVFDIENTYTGESLEFMLYEYPDICTDDSCDDCMFENEYDIFDVSKISTVNKITDISKHIVILFDPEDPKGSNNQIYEQLNYVIDKIVYDVMTLNNGVLPRINLIAHSRGGLTAMQYTLDHSFLVDSLITLGTPYEGTTFGLEPILNALEMSADPSSDYFSFGVKDILDYNVYNEYKERWNSGYQDKYSHINFRAVGSVATYDGISYILENDTYILNEFWNSVVKSIDFTADVSKLLGLAPFYDDDVFILGDLFINTFSQVASTYTGVKQYLRVFDASDIDLSTLAQAHVAIPHNLEPGDSVIHEYILRNIRTGSALNYALKSDGTYKVVGIDSISEDGGVSIPATVDGVAVTEIAAFAFAGNTNIVSVTVPSSVKRIGHSAFLNCTALQGVSFDGVSTLELIEDEAFSGCSALTSFAFPTGLKELGAFSFSRTGITSFTIGDSLTDISSKAFASSALVAYTVSESNELYSVTDGILYSKDGRGLISYPSGKSATSFTMPSNVEEIYPYAFYGADNLTSVNLGSLIYIGTSAFAGCKNLAVINAPELLLAGASAFSDTAYINSSTPLKSIGKVLVSYSGTDTSLSLYDYFSIAPQAFSSCDNLTSITIGGPITSIGMMAFADAKNLTNIYIDSGSHVYIDHTAFNSGTSGRKIYVAASLIEEYRTDDFWVYYANELSTHQTVIKFDSNGGDAVSDGQATYYAVLGTLPIPNRNGYYFTGWSFSNGGESVAAIPSYLWTSLAEEVTFTASWAINTYSVNLYPNGGALENDTLSYTVNDSLTLPTPTKVGYSFDGWYDNAELTGEAVSALPVGSYGNKIYYAKWNPNTYTATLQYDGQVIGTVDIEYGSSSFYIAPYEKEGYQFHAWQYIDSLGFNTSCTTESGNAAIVWSIASDIVLTPYMTVERYYIKFDKNDDSDAFTIWLYENALLGEVEDSIEYGKQFGSYNDMVSSFNSFHHVPGKILTGFRIIDSDGNEVNSDFLTGASSNIITDLGDNEEVFILEPLYADETYNIIFNGYESLGISGIKYGDSLALPTASTYGYNFINWRIVSISGMTNESLPENLRAGVLFNPSTMPDISYGIESATSTLYLEAYFTPITVTVSYAPAYFDGTGALIGNTNIAYDASVYTFPVPSDSGRLFIGWYDSAGNQYSDSSGSLIRKWDKAENITLTARWSYIEYTITYHVASGATHSNVQKYTRANTVVLSNAALYGHTFNGWYTASSGGNSITQIGPNASGNIDIYGRFTANVYTITFINEKGVSEQINGSFGSIITAPELNGGYYYTYGNVKLNGKAYYTVTMTQNITFVATEKTLDECQVSPGVFEIYTANQLNAIRNVPTATVYLKYDINWSGTWEPIPSWSGYFHGGGFHINDLTINTSASDSGGAIGMFCVNYGTIEMLTLQMATINISAGSTSSTVHAGLIAGINYGNIISVGMNHSTVTTGKSTTTLGAVAGLNLGNIYYCILMSVNLDGNGDMGMVAGSSSGGRIRGCEVFGNYARLSISGANRSIGGIVGHANNGCIIEYCRVSGVDFSFGTYTGIDQKELQPFIGYIVGCLQNSTMNEVIASNVTLSYGGLPDTFTRWFTKYYPRANVCSAGNGTVGANVGGTIGNTNWTGVVDDIK